MEEKKNNPIEEVYEEYGGTRLEAQHSTEEGRKNADSIYTVLLVAGLIGLGLVLLLLSVFVKAMSDWTVGGIVFILFGILLFAVGSKVTK